MCWIAIKTKSYGQGQDFEPSGSGGNRLVNSVDHGCRAEVGLQPAKRFPGFKVLALAASSRTRSTALPTVAMTTSLGKQAIAGTRQM